MGCDIHTFLEVKHYKYDDKEKKNGTWVNADKWSINTDSALYPEEYDGIETFEIDYDDRLYTGRNYCLFAVLANVRNYWDIKPISEPKGMPEDASSVVKKECDKWDCDGHSHSYLTLTEILNYDGWNIPDEGADFALSEEHAKELEAEYGDNHIATIPQSVGFKIRYKTNTKELCHKFFDTAVKRMESLLRNGYKSTDEVRMVFWFDN